MIWRAVFKRLYLCGKSLLIVRSAKICVLHPNKFISIVDRAFYHVTSKQISHRPEQISAPFFRARSTVRHSRPSTPRPSAHWQENGKATTYMIIRERWGIGLRPPSPLGHPRRAQHQNLGLGQRRPRLGAATRRTCGEIQRRSDQSHKSHFAHQQKSVALTQLLLLHTD